MKNASMSKINTKLVHVQNDMWTGLLVAVLFVKPKKVGDNLCPYLDDRLNKPWCIFPKMAMQLQKIMKLFTYLYKRFQLAFHTVS